MKARGVRWSSTHTDYRECSARQIRRLLPAVSLWRLLFNLGWLTIMLFTSGPTIAARRSRQLDLSLKTFIRNAPLPSWWSQFTTQPTDTTVAETRSPICNHLKEAAHADTAKTWLCDLALICDLWCSAQQSTEQDRGLQRHKHALYAAFEGQLVDKESYPSKIPFLSRALPSRPGECASHSCFLGGPQLNAVVGLDIIGCAHVFAKQKSELRVATIAIARGESFVGDDFYQLVNHPVIGSVARSSNPGTLTIAYHGPLDPFANELRHMRREALYTHSGLVRAAVGRLYRLGVRKGSR